MTAKTITYISTRVYHNYIEETEEGELIEHLRFEIAKEITATVLEDRKHSYKLLMPDGNTIVKRKKNIAYLE